VLVRHRALNVPGVRERVTEMVRQAMKTRGMVPAVQGRRVLHLDADPPPAADLTFHLLGSTRWQLWLLIVAFFVPGGIFAAVRSRSPALGFFHSWGPAVLVGAGITLGGPMLVFLGLRVARRSNR
jgi:hypothetical protein